VEKPDFPKYVDSTARKSLVACQTQANYAYIRHLKPKGTNIHLHFGGCLAKGLEVVRKAYYGEGLSFDDSLILGIKAIIIEWQWEETPDYGTAGNKTFERCVEALISFFEEYPPDTDPIRPLMTEKGPAIEFTFALPIPDVYHPQTGEPMLYTGRFDMLADYGGAIFINDEKTASQLGAGWMNNWKLGSQMTGYSWACREYGFPAQGVVIRGIGILKTMIKHQLLIERRDQWMIDRWLVQLQRDVKRIIKAWEEDYFDMALDDACSSYNGCPYAALCLAKDPAPWIEADYEVRVWDPLVK